MEIRKVASPSLPPSLSPLLSLPPFLYSRLCSSKSEISVRAVAPLTKFRRPENSAGKVNGLARIPTRVTLGPSCRETVPPKRRNNGGPHISGQFYFLPEEGEIEFIDLLRLENVSSR